MAKFCGKCGSPLNESGLCPNCDVETVSPKKKKNQKALPIVLAIIVFSFIVTGVLYANHTGRINLPFLKNNQKNEQTSGISISENSDNTQETKVFSPEKAYASVIENYKEAFANNYYSDSEDDFPDEDEYNVSKINSFLLRRYNGILEKLYYCFYDLSADDIPELIIGMSSSDESNCKVIDILGFENNEVKRLFSIGNYSERTDYYFYPDGIICCYGSNGAADHSEQYYLLDKNSASPVIQYNLNTISSEFGEEYYLVSEDDRQKISEDEYNEIVEKYDEGITLDWETLCECKVYESSFSTRTDNGTANGYHQILVTKETNDTLTAAYRQIGQEGYPVYAKCGTVFTVNKNGDVADVSWEDGAENEYKGTVSYKNDCFTLSFKTSSSSSVIKECTETELFFKSSDDADDSAEVTAATPKPSAAKPSTTKPSTTKKKTDITLSNDPSSDELTTFLVGTWNVDLSVEEYTTMDTYVFTSSGGCKMLHSGTPEGTYKIDSQRNLYIKLPWNEVNLKWDTQDLENRNGWCITSDGKFIARGVVHWRDSE